MEKKQDNPYRAHSAFHIKAPKKPKDEPKAVKTAKQNKDLRSK